MEAANEFGRDREVKMTQQNDANPEETKEWLDALHSVIEAEGIDRAHYLISQLTSDAFRTGDYSPATIVNTPYRNTIFPLNEERMPGDVYMERQIRGIIRWNALAMVMRANKREPTIGGHISTFPFLIARSHLSECFMCLQLNLRTILLCRTPA